MLVLENQFAIISSFMLSISKKIFQSLLVLVLLCSMQHALAQNGFTDLSFTPNGGTVGANGTLSISFFGNVNAVDFQDAVSTVRLHEGGAILREVSYNVSYNRFGVPVNNTVNFGFGVALGAGTHQIYLEAITVNGGFNSQVMTVVIQPPPPPPFNGAGFVSQSVPAIMVAGQSYPVSVTMANTGTKTWTPGGAYPYRIGVQSPSDKTWNFARAELPVSVSPGGQATFNFAVTAPQGGGSVGFQAMMLQEGVEWFGSPTPVTTVQVSIPQPTVTFSSPAVGYSVTAVNPTVTVAFAGSAAPGTGAAINTLQLLESGVSFASTNSSNISAGKALTAGSHTIEVRVTDSRGQVASAMRTITVVAQPSPGSPSAYTPIPVNVTLPTFGSSEAGTLPGGMSVGNDGAANYSINLLVPPGTGDMQPQLSLNYSSNGGNGMLGLGWSLGGMSTIHRCAKTISQDGYPGRIAFDSGDRLCLDGMRLLRFDGSGTSDASYWQNPNGAQYRTEIENFARITRQASGGFKVELKDGRIQYYGVDVNSSIAAQGRTDGQPLLWALARTEDRSGNYMVFEYTVDSITGEYLPKQIRYGGNTNAGQPTDIAVRFQTEPRGDAQIQYMGGSRNDLRSRLTHIQTFINTGTDGSGGTLARDYAIVYKQSANSARSLVDYVQVCSQDGKCLPRTQMGWGSNPIKLAEKYTFINYIQGDDDTDPNKWTSGDFDGSGKTTVLYAAIGPRPCMNCVSQLPRPITGHLVGIRDINGHIVNVDTSLTIPAGNTFSELISGDMNGDGRDDLVLVDVRSRNWVYCLAVTSANNSPAFAPCQLGGTLPSARNYASKPGDLPNMVSLNNDGKAQLIALDANRVLHVYSYDNNAITHITKATNISGGIPSLTPVFDVFGISLSKHGMSDFYSAWTYPSGAAGGLSTCNYNADILTCKVAISGGYYDGLIPADINGDGLTDIFASGTGCLSKESDVDCRNFAPGMGKTELTFVGPADFIGNGVNGFWATSYSPFALSLCQIIDTGNLCHRADISGYPTDSLAAYSGDFYSIPFFIDDSGIPASLNCSTPWYNQSYFSERCRVSSAIVPANEDRLTSVVNGIGQREEVDYARGDDTSVYSRHASLSGAIQSAVYPQKSVAPGTMVKTVRLSNGQGGWLASNYRYAGYMFDVSGRGALGFTTKSVTDANGITTDTTMAQTFPYIGMALHVAKSNAGCRFEDTTNTLSKIPFNLNTGGQNYFVNIQRVDSTQLIDCIDTRTISTVNQYSDGWGNLNDQTIITTARGASFTVETTTAYNVGNGVNFLSGLPLTAKTKRTDPVTGTLTRTMAYTYDSFGRITSQTVEPDTAALTLTTSFDRTANAYGLINTQIQTWVNPACANSAWMTIKKNNCTANMRVILSDVTYDAKGRFVTTEKNALGQAETRTYDGKSGLQTSRVDANKLTTTWSVDTLGRVTSEETPDHNQKRTNARDCQGICPNGATLAMVTEFFHGTDRIAPSQISYIDSAGHQVRSMTWGFDGRVIIVDQRFDGLGRLSEADFPRFDNEPAYLSRRIGYDNFNRITSTTTVDSGGTEQTAKTDYKGLVADQTNAKAQKRTETYDAIGQIIKVEDSNTPVRGVSLFSYDPFGNLSKTVDPNNNVISVVYDLLGRRIQLTDPDLGTIAYGIDPAGRNWSHESPNLRARATKNFAEFDVLNRMIGRYETDLESHWTYDTAINGIGRLSDSYTLIASGKDYIRTLAYDSFGRLTSVSQKISDGIYTTQTEYDDWSRPITSIYQRGSDTRKTFSTRYNAWGYKSRIERGSLVLWNITAQDALNRASSITLGNGLVSTKHFNTHTGLLDSGNVSSGSSARLQEAYEYDALGNATRRSQYWDAGGFMESLHYDALNRLDTSTLGAVTKSFTYDYAGNILSKTDAGTYSYPSQGAAAVRPHAVSTLTSPSGVVSSFAYDANGNLTGGQTFGTWTSFDMPIRLTKGTVWSDFTYGPDHQRTGQHRSDDSWVYYAGAQEVEIKTGVTTVKTYWPDGIGVEIERGTSSTELSWTHGDRLGSIIALTSESGIIREKLEYDVWGKRRNTDDNNSTPDSLDGKIDNRGFTGHEMLDNLDLVHMNGRVYNPFTAKFLSADPQIQDFYNGQNYNRYSYVLNNPTNLTDPTGYEWTEYVPVYGSAMDSKAAFSEGRMWMGAFHAALAIGDVGSLGAGTLIKDGIKFAIKSEIKHEAAASLAKQGAEQAAAATEKATEKSVAKETAKQSEKAATDSAAGDAGGSAAKRGNDKNKYTPGGNFSPKSKKEIAERAGHKCEYCDVDTVPAKKSQKGVTPPGNEAQTDHIDPKSLGGTNSPENGAHACRDCNQGFSNNPKPNPRAEQPEAPSKKPEEKTE